MRLSEQEFLAMNNPVRRMVQRYVEFRIFRQLLKKHNVTLTGRAILEAGCGSGYGTELLFKTFAPSRLVALDIMPEQIELAKKRHIAAEIFIGDMTRINLPSHSFDAVFVFGVLHHIPAWRTAQLELSRVLKPGGVLLIEELSRRAVGFFERFGFHHPIEARFDFQEFENGLGRAGFEIRDQRRICGLSGMKSYLCVKKSI